MSHRNELVDTPDALDGYHRTSATNKETINGQLWYDMVMRWLTGLTWETIKPLRVGSGLRTAQWGSTTREERFPSQRVNQVSILISLAITVLLQGRRTVWRVLPDADKERGNNQEHEEGNGPGETDSSNFLLQDNLENQEAV